MKKKATFDFAHCMALMRKRDPEDQEEGFHELLPLARQHVGALITELADERDHGLRCWLLELIGEACAPEALPVLEAHLTASDEALRGWAVRGLALLATPEARKLLWEARSYELDTPGETEAFRHALTTSHKPRAR